MSKLVNTATEIALRDTVQYYEISTWVLTGVVVLLTVALVTVVNICMHIQEKKQAEARKEYEATRAQDAPALLPAAHST